MEVAQESSEVGSGEKLRTRFCHECSWKNKASARFCSGCGTELLRLSVTACSRCGSELRPGAKYCSQCGYDNFGMSLGDQGA